MSPSAVDLVFSLKATGLIPDIIPEGWGPTVNLFATFGEKAAGNGNIFTPDETKEEPTIRVEGAVRSYL